MLNKALLIGRLGKDPELSYTQAGTARCRFSLATSEVYYDKQTNEKKEETEWHNIVVWGKQGESCGKYLEKGRLVHVEGTIKTRSWDDQNSGQKKYITEIKALRVTFLQGGEQRSGGGNQGGGGYQGGGGPNDGAGQGGGGNVNQGGGGYQGPPDDDDIPF